MVSTGRDKPASFTVGALVLATLVIAASSGISAAGAQQAATEADNTVTQIQVHPSGEATWTVQFRTRLETQQQVDDFQAFQDAFRQNTSEYLDPFSDRIRGVVDRAANATGRPMAASNFSASTSIQEVPRRWGVVTFEFTWSGFAEQRNDRLVVGDVFQGGFFLAANDSLKLAVPDGYDVTSVEPTPDERDAGVLIWHGREDFSDGHPAVVIEAGQSPGTTGGWIQTGGQSGLYIGGALLVALIVIGSYALRRRGTFRGGPTGSEGPSVTTSTEEGGPGPTGDDGTVKTDSERVEVLLERHGGRMKQAAIADELGWSDSKVSRVVSGMADEGLVTKLQLGRENLVELDEEE